MRWSGFLAARAPLAQDRIVVVVNQKMTAITAMPTAQTCATTCQP